MLLPRRAREAAAALAAALLLAGSSPAGAAPIEKAQWFKLENGLQVVFLPQPSTPLVASTVIVRAGTRHEPPGLTGATHFLEHLLFNGTARRTQKEIYDAIDRLGAYNNASTRADMTIFQLLVHRDDLAEGLDIQADMLFNSTLPPEKFEKERGIVIEEIGQRFDLPQAAAERFSTETLHAGTPYSRPVLGTPESIRSLSRDAVWEYYKALYQPANMVVVLMGGVEREELAAALAKTFGLAKAGPLPERAPLGGFSPTGRKVVGRRVEAQRTYLTLNFRAPKLTDPDFPAFTTLVAMLNAGTTSRLEAVFKGEGAPRLYDLDSGVSSEMEAPVFSVSATLPPDGDGQAVIRMLLEALERLARGDVTAEALERAKVGARAREAFLEENILYYGFFQAPYLACAPPESVRSLPGRLQKVTLEEVVEEAGKLFSGGPFLATLYGPSAPEGEHPWEGPALAEAPGKAAPKPSGEEPPVETAPAPVSRKLEGGPTVIVQERPDTKIFAIHLLARDRALFEPEGKAGIAELMHRLLTEGTLHRSAEQIGRELEDIGAQLKVTDNPDIPYDDYYLSPEYSYVRFEVMDSFALQGLAQLADLVLYPRFAEEDLERVRNRQLDDIAKAEERARSRSGRLFRETLFGGHPLARPILGTATSVGSITREDLKAFHARYFAPENLILSVVSPRPAGEVASWLAFYFGREHSSSGSRSAWPTLPGGSKPKEAEEKMGKAQSYLVMGQVFEASEGEREALEVMNALLSDRLAFELRERRGLAYSVGTSVVETQAGWYFAAGLGTREENLEEARRGVIEALRALQKEPPGEAEVAKTVNGLIGAAFRRRLTGIGQAYFLGLDAFRGREPGQEEAWSERLRKVSGEEVRRASGRIEAERMTATIVR